MMESLPGVLQTLGILTNFALLASTRVGASIRWLAIQGLLIGAMPLFLHAGASSLRLWLVVVTNLVMKGIVFPALLLRLRARTGFHREVEPFVGLSGSLLFGLAALGFSMWLAARVNGVMAGRPFIVLDAALFLILTGLFLIITRRKAVMQVLGYVVLENGIFVFGLSTVVDTPVLVELGVLLDAFVAVFVMGIAIFQINREFSDIDVGRLNALRD